MGAMSVNQRDRVLLPIQYIIRKPLEDRGQPVLKVVFQLSSRG